MLSLCSRSVLIVGAFFAVTTCRAGQVNATLTGTTNNGTINLHLQLHLPNSSDDVDINYARTGLMNWTNNSGPIAGLGPTFSTFCIEINADVSLNTPVPYNLVPVQNAPDPGNGSGPGGGNGGMGQAKAEAIARLWFAHYSSTLNDKTNAAAFQLAIWRIEYDYGVTAGADFAKLNIGNFQASDYDGTGTAAIDLASSWLGADFTTGTMATGLIALSSGNPDFQDQILQTPEPSTLCLATIGGLMFTTFGWRRWRKNNRIGN